MQYKDKITFIYLKTHNNLELNLKKLKELSQQAYCYYKTPSDQEIIQISSHCIVRYNVQKTINKSIDYLLSDVPSVYDYQVITSNNFLFLFEIVENQIDKFIEQIGQISLLHNKNPFKKHQNKFIYQNGSLIYLFVQYQDEFSTVCLYGFHLLANCQLRRCVSLRRLAGMDITQILKIINKNLDQNAAKVIQNNRDYLKAIDLFPQFKNLEDITQIVHYQNEQPLQQLIQQQQK